MRSGPTTELILNGIEWMETSWSTQQKLTQVRTGHAIHVRVKIRINFILPPEVTIKKHQSMTGNRECKN
jgi:hypothetical protein